MLPPIPRLPTNYKCGDDEILTTDICLVAYWVAREGYGSLPAGVFVKTGSKQATWVLRGKQEWRDRCKDWTKQQVNYRQFAGRFTDLCEVAIEAISEVAKAMAKAQSPR